MALTAIQRDVCRFLAGLRRAPGERYVAGGVALSEDVSTAVPGPAWHSRAVATAHMTLIQLSKSAHPRTTKYMCSARSQKIGISAAVSSALFQAG